MPRGLGTDDGVEIGNLADCGNQLRRRLIALRVWVIGRAEYRHVAAQRYDVANARVPIGPDYLVGFRPRRADAGQMRRRRQHRFLNDALARAMRTLAR